MVMDVRGYRTILFNLILVIVGTLDMAGISLPDNFADDLNGAILAVVGVVGVILRAVTKTPIGKK